MVSFLVLSIGFLIRRIRCSFTHNIRVFLYLLDILPILTVTLICQQQLLPQLFLLFIAITTKGMEVGIIILVQDGINDGVLQLLWGFVALKDLEDE